MSTSKYMSPSQSMMVMSLAPSGGSSMSSSSLATPSLFKKHSSLAQHKKSPKKKTSLGWEDLFPQRRGSSSTQSSSLQSSSWY